MTISREHLLYGCLALGFALTYVPIFTWLRLRHYYPNGGMPGARAAFIKYGLLFLVGAAALAGTVYVLLHPALRALTLSVPVLGGLGVAGVVLLVGAILNLPRLRKTVATLDSQPPVVRDSLLETEQLLSGRASLKMRLRIWGMTVIFLILFGAVYYYENTVNPPSDDAAASAANGQT